MTTIYQQAYPGGPSAWSYTAPRAFGSAPDVDLIEAGRRRAVDDMARERVERAGRPRPIAPDDGGV